MPAMEPEKQVNLSIWVKTVGHHQHYTVVVVMLSGSVQNAVVPMAWGPGTVGEGGMGGCKMGDPCRHAILRKTLKTSG